VNASGSGLPSDPLWPRASDWLGSSTAARAQTTGLAILGVPACLTSISPTRAHLTPTAVRDALSKYSTWAAGLRTDVASLNVLDLGDVADPDGPDGEARVAEAVAALAGTGTPLVALGGDNSITYSVMSGLFGGRLADVGLITVDAHHDLRDGESNGSPVRRLIEAGLPGENVVQIGIADFSNSAAYGARARDCGVTVIPRSELRGGNLEDLVVCALEIAGSGGRPVYVDLDVDVCDRAFVPACPAAAPGGITPDELRQIAFLLARDRRVHAFDITEIDAGADSRDQRTVRLAALLVLEVAAGICTRVVQSRPGWLHNQE